MTFQRFVEIIVTICKSKCTNEEEQTGVAKSEEWKQFFWLVKDGESIRVSEAAY